jgi:hypothetical protein
MKLTRGTLRELGSARSLPNAEHAELKVVELSQTLSFTEASNLLALRAWEEGDSLITFLKDSVLFAVPGERVVEYVGDFVRYRALPERVQGEVDQVERMLAKPLIRPGAFNAMGACCVGATAAIGLLLGWSHASMTEVVVVGGSFSGVGAIYIGIAEYLRKNAKNQLHKTLERVALSRKERNQGLARGELLAKHGFTDPGSQIFRTRMDSVEPHIPRRGPR